LVEFASMPVSPVSQDGLPIRMEAGLRRRPAPARGPAELPWLRMAVVSAASVAALAYLAEHDGPEHARSRPPPARPPLALSAPAASWQQVATAPPLFAVDAAPLKGQPALVDVRTSLRGGREDLLVFGSLADVTAPFVRLVVARNPGDAAPPSSLFVDLVRRAAEAGMAVTRSAPGAALATKFGAFEATPIALGTDGPRACIGFRGQHTDMAFRVLGWFCGGAAAPATREALVCVIDGLELTSAAADPALKAMFAQAERRRECRDLRVVETAKRSA
jgi:hypothetical protein